MIFYKLDENDNPVKCNTEEYNEWFLKNQNIHVADDTIKDKHGNEVRVSTVFLGMDHSFTYQKTKPILWETMIVGGEHDQYQVRYTSKSEALEGHKAAIQLVLLT